MFMPFAVITFLPTWRHVQGLYHVIKRIVVYDGWCLGSCCTAALPFPQGVWAVEPERDVHRAGSMPASLTSASRPSAGSRLMEWLRRDLRVLMQQEDVEAVAAVAGSLVANARCGVASPAILHAVLHAIFHASDLACIALAALTRRSHWRFLNVDG